MYFFLVQVSLSSILFDITAARLSLTRDTEPLFFDMAQSRESWFNSYVLQFHKCKLAAELIGRSSRLSIHNCIKASVNT